MARNPNVYEMYVANENRAGFFVQRRTWGNTIARIVAINGVEEGALPGAPPYHGNPKVTADVFNLHTGELLNRSELSCPGTFQYALLSAEQLPEWARRTIG